MPHELPNNLTLKILENKGVLGKSQNWAQTGAVSLLVQ